MITTVKKYSSYTGLLALIGLMLATRVHHFGSAFTLPDASLIVFFFSGLFFNRVKFFILLLAEAALIDYVAISQFNVSDFCVSPAYVALTPTYGVMWWAGSYCRRFKMQNNQELAMQFGLLFLATSAAFLISDGSFYLFSGRYANAELATYLTGAALYYPSYVTATLIYGLLIGTGLKVFHAFSTQNTEAENMKV
jgi:hypothetical protein